MVLNEKLKNTASCSYFIRIFAESSHLCLRKRVQTIHAEVSGKFFLKKIEPQMEKGGTGKANI